ncbi:hypothetical protein B0T17DRAFT_650122 [Bombardia bombarda]|uniref:Uncharacterized protein n=1 Tax=Bombardia bombarda TaxID=252184 RepID=A0AA40CF24_9PEZI|nr:hypothetical protein B0T17DRAFT_650122 [Bombardia bombarda]
MSSSPTTQTPSQDAEMMDGKYKEPLAGMVISVVLAMVSLVIISSFLTQRYLAVKVWRRLPFVQWLVFAIYTDSFLFVFATAVLQFGFGVDNSTSVCESAILLCLVCYVTTKLIYMFLVEKAYIIRSGSKKLRLHSKLYIFNAFGMLGVYCVVVALNFIYRITRMVNGQCVIGMKKLGMIPLIAFDLLVNIYLTVLFLIPLFSLYSFRNFQQTPGNRRLKTVAMRTFVGCVCTLTSSIANLSVLMALDGEPGWVCLMCCNSDILFSAIVIQWVTSRDSMSPASSDSLSLSQPNHVPPADDMGVGGAVRKMRRLSNGRHLVEEANATTTTTTNTNNTTPSGGSNGRRRSCSSVDSSSGNVSPRMTPSTKAFVDDVGEIALDPPSPPDSCCTTNHHLGLEQQQQHPLSASSSNSSTANTMCAVAAAAAADGSKGGPGPSEIGIATTTTTAAAEIGSEQQHQHTPRRVTHQQQPPPPRPSPSEVLVSVDYGADSLSRDAARDARVRLGNSIVIGAGRSTDVMKVAGRWAYLPTYLHTGGRKAEGKSYELGFEEIDTPDSF